MQIAVREADIRIHDLRTRMPFRYGITTLTRTPHLILRLRVEVNGISHPGRAADHLPPKWFTKNPATSFAADVQEMVEVITSACDLAMALPPAGSVFELWRSLYETQKEWGRSRGLPALLWNFGVSLVERAVIEAFCRATRLEFATALRANAFEIELSEIYPGARRRVTR